MQQGQGPRDPYRRRAPGQPYRLKYAGRPKRGHAADCACWHCKNDAKWERIYREKFADPTYYAVGVITPQSPLRDL